jgi:hypothetical protein
MRGMDSQREDYAEPEPAVWLSELLSWAVIGLATLFAATLGLAIVAAVVATATDGGGGDPQATLDGYRIGLLVPVAGALLALAITLPGLRSTFAAA